MFKLSYGWAIILMVFAISFAGCDDDDDTVTPPGTITEIASDDDRFTILTAALVRTGLDATLNAAGTFTVFAPTDAAFTASGIDLTALSDADLTNVLLYHVLGGVVTAADLSEGDNFANTLGAFGPNGSSLSVLVNKTGSAVTVNGDATVVVADITAANGVIHAIDQVLSPQTIVDFATKTGALSSLAGALTTANLVGALSAAGPFTVFAPNNIAFADAASVIATLTPEQVATVLTYHVVGNANVRSDAIPATATTLAMQDLTFTGEGNATIVTASGQEVPIALADIQGTNGVVHVIGTVLVPTL
jgi:transforming growth factor-beta-induced protein